MSDRTIDVNKLKYLIVGSVMENSPGLAIDYTDVEQAFPTGSGLDLAEIYARAYVMRDDRTDASRHVFALQAVADAARKEQ